LYLGKYTFLDNVELQLKYLFDKSIWTDADYAVFLKLLSNNPPTVIQNIFGEKYISELSFRTPVDSVRANQILEQIHLKIGNSYNKPIEKRISRWRPIRWPAAASVIFFIGVAVYVGLLNKKLANSPAVSLNVKAEILAPRSNRATITLANGQKLFLDSASNGTLAIQGAVRIEKLADGQIMYSGNTQDLAMNTLVNPRGSKVINIKLSDGSMVWLNSESSLTYPTSFTGHGRKVTISGEAYFEVAHNKEMPFTVSHGGTTVQVLGTHFNVNAFEDEQDIKVTLLEGSIRIINKTNKAILKPGQQAIINSKIKVTNDVNMEQVMAWKNGLFDFSGDDLTTVLKQLGRWYDLKIVYPAVVPAYRFQGQLQRDLNLSQVLRALGESEVKFKLSDSTLIIQ
jgi:transmembrane sensor